ncbi:hypothetical protein HMI54_009580 [Coelomomyces lativittatus]|nr:hypothetical protein HMI55_006159 [Coelomomyces lativittatus]KAJ1516409.1 hypothetical protein HMI54_009580 [Coelomomyces lativittatus]
MQTLDLSQYNLDILPSSHSNSKSTHPYSRINETKEMYPLENDYIEEMEEFEEDDEDSNSVQLMNEMDHDDLHQLGKPPLMKNTAFIVGKQYHPPSFQFSKEKNTNIHDLEVAPGVFVIDQSQNTFSNHSYPSHSSDLGSIYPSSPLYPPSNACSASFLPPPPSPSLSSSTYATNYQGVSLSSYPQMEIHPGNSPVSPIFPTSQGEQTSSSSTLPSIFFRKRRRMKLKRHASSIPPPISTSTSTPFSSHPPPLQPFPPSSSLRATIPSKKKVRPTLTCPKWSPSCFYSQSHLPTSSIVEPCTPPASSTSSTACSKPITAMAAEETWPTSSSVAPPISTPSMLHSSTDLLSIQVSSPCFPSPTTHHSSFFEATSMYPMPTPLTSTPPFQTAWPISTPSYEDLLRSTHRSSVENEEEPNHYESENEMEEDDEEDEVDDSENNDDEVVVVECIENETAHESTLLSDHHELLARTIQALQELAQLGYMLQPLVQGDWVSNIERWRFHAPVFPLSNSTSTSTSTSTDLLPTSIKHPPPPSTSASSSTSHWIDGHPTTTHSMQKRRPCGWPLTTLPSLDHGHELF